jgi:Fe-S-cluster containining protein
MTDRDPTPDTQLDAGDFASWLVEIRGAIRGDNPSDVPCGSCTACCTASQFIHIAPDETDALAHIPSALLFPAPRLPRGHVLMGYNERGQCPMLIDNRCSIYEHRPRTCRTYDCRVFAATRLEPDDDEKILIAHQARRWRFSFATQADHDAYDALCTTASRLRLNRSELPQDISPSNTTQIAIHAIEITDTH